MAKFLTEPDIKKQKRQRIWDWVTVILGVVFIASFFMINRGGDGDMDLLFRSLQVLYFSVIVYSSVARLSSKRKAVFVEVTDEHIAFRNTEWGADKKEVIIISWSDIKWIKLETNSSISVFQASSFSINFSIKNFSKETQEDILMEIEPRAIERDIRLINFPGQPAPVLA